MTDAKKDIAATHDVPEAQETVVLLHGFAGVTIMNKPLARALRRAGYRTIELGYDSWGLSLSRICDRLVPRLASRLGAAPGRVHFVGHSMGGLVARALIHRIRPANLGHVVMLGTPNAGSEIADFAVAWPLLRPLLGRAAPALVTQRPAEVDALLGPIDYSVGIIAGDNAGLKIGFARFFSGPSDGRVSVASTRLAEAADHIILPLQHNMLFYHPSTHRQVRHFLRHGHFTRSAA